MQLFWTMSHVWALVLPPATHVMRSIRLGAILANDDASRPFQAEIVGVSREDTDYANICDALISRGFRPTDCQGSQDTFVYRYQKATGLLQLVSFPNTLNSDDFPKWIPLVNDMESVLIRNGWSFLDPDESEPMSPFDIDVAKLEGTYKPKWGQGDDTTNQSMIHLSSLGFDVTPMSSLQVVEVASLLTSKQSRRTLLEGATDPSGQKTTCNGINFSGPAGQSDIPSGIFTCAISSLPLFSTVDLLPTTSSSGWLSFARPIADDHIHLVPPEANFRVEVICAKSRCHLGHYFGSDGFCINASALIFCRDEQLR